MRKITIAVLILTCVCLAQEARVKYIAKSTHLGVNVIAVTCLNGADPTGTKAGQNVLLVSCGK
jgi:hypothetical protein